MSKVRTRPDAICRLVKATTGARLHQIAEAHRHRYADHKWIEFYFPFHVVAEIINVNNLDLANAILAGDVPGVFAEDGIPHLSVPQAIEAIEKARREKKS